mgnify:CR=1 FL=1
MNDIVVSSSNYTINGNTIKGNIVVDQAMRNKYLGRYKFVDIRTTSIINTYTVNFFAVLTKSTTTNSITTNHVLYAIWKEATPSNCDGSTIICINNLTDLTTSRNEVNAGDNKEGKYYILTSDINMGGLFDSNGNMLTGSTNWTAIGTSRTQSPIPNPQSPIPNPH